MWALLWFRTSQEPWQVGKIRWGKFRGERTRKQTGPLQSVSGAHKINKYGGGGQVILLISIEGRSSSCTCRCTKLCTSMGRKNARKNGPSYILNLPARHRTGSLQAKLHQTREKNCPSSPSSTSSWGDLFFHQPGFRRSPVWSCTLSRRPVQPW